MVRGIGGIFIYASDAPALVEWYKTHLGLRFDFEDTERSYYQDFVLPIDQAYGRTEREVFAIRQADPGSTGRRRLVINLRVSDLDGLLAHLRKQGIPAIRTQSFDYGRFAWLNDPDGNEIELFETA